MLRKDIRKSTERADLARGSTADAEEVARFNRLADEWWKADGAFKTVHAFNAARVGYLSERLPQLCGRDPNAPAPLAGLSIADIGCGAGIVTEPMSRLGAETLGVDAAERNTLIATRHAAANGAPVRYRHGLPEDLVAEGRHFDIVLSLEVVEHVADVPTFLRAVGALVAPGGLLVIGTLNRTALSYVKAIIGAEYLLRWLPKGTHDWRKFVRPAELATHLTPLDFTVIEAHGVSLNPFTMRWHVGGRADTTYLQVHRRARAEV